VGAMIKGMIFDLGGVIVEWSNSITYQYIEEKYDIDFYTIKTKLEEKLPLVQMSKLSEKEWLEEFFRSLNIEPPEDYEKIWRKTFEDSKYNEDVIRIIKALKENNFKLAVLSNIEFSRAAWERKRGIIDYFDVVVFSCELGTRKTDNLKWDKSPEVDIFRLTIDAIGLKQEECVYIDDNFECIKAAEEVGIKGILFKNAEQLKRDLKNYNIKIE
jgi:2-haloacid dehalogenase